DVGDVAVGRHVVGDRGGRAVAPGSGPRVWADRLAIGDPSPALAPERDVEARRTVVAVVADGGLDPQRSGLASFLEPHLCHGPLPLVLVAALGGPDGVGDRRIDGDTGDVGAAIRARG